MYKLTTENYLDLIELDIYEEKANNGSSKLATHMKKYYKYYLVAGALVAGITAAIIVAKKNGDKEEVKLLEDSLKEAKKAKDEAKEIIKENKKTLAKLTNKTVNVHPIQIQKEIDEEAKKISEETAKMEKVLKDIKDKIPNKYKSVVYKEIPKEIPKVSLNDGINRDLELLSKITGDRHTGSINMEYINSIGEGDLTTKRVMINSDLDTDKRDRRYNAYHDGIRKKDKKNEKYGKKRVLFGIPDDKPLAPPEYRRRALRRGYKIIDGQYDDKDEQPFKSDLYYDTIKTYVDA